MQDFANSLIDFLTHMSVQFGTGVLVNDIFLFLFFLGIITLLIAVAAFRKTYNLRTPPGLERVNAIGGKVEKVEMNLGEFRIETVRNLELFRGDLGYLKQELSDISRLLKRLAASGGKLNMSSDDSVSIGRTSSATEGEFASYKSQDEEELPSDPLNRGQSGSLLDPRIQKKN